MSVNRHADAHLSSELALVLAVWCVLASVQLTVGRCTGALLSFACAWLLVEAWPGRRDAFGAPRAVRPWIGLLAFLAAGFVLQPWLGWLAVLVLEAATAARVEVGAPSRACVTEAVAILVLAPAFEERLYRGRLLGALQPRVGTPLAVLASTIAFALPHVDALRIIGTGLAGLVLGVVAVSTRHTRPCIAMHVGFNAAALTQGLAVGVPHR